MNLSVVIITKNEAINIVDCILSAKKVSRNIVVVDAGSSDATVLLAKREQVSVFSLAWNGYGHARNVGALFADNDWIMALDADERITDHLAEQIRNLKPTNNNMVYGFQRTNYFGNKRIRFGEPANDRVLRLYNRQYHCWNLVPVHEKLNTCMSERLFLPSKLIHLGIRGANHYRYKKMGYASLCAIKYFEEKRKLAVALTYLSPAFNFIKGYIFQLGFLDLRIGLTVARINASYTWKKYNRLHALQQERRPAIEFSMLRNSIRKIISFLT